MRPSRVPRVTRGAVAATVATFFALFSHVAGGGAMPGWLGIFVPWMLSLALCIILAGRHLSAVRLSVAVLLSQAIFHSLFVLGTTSAVTGDAVVGHVHGASESLASTTATTAMLHGDVTMWLWHGVAAAVTVAVIYRGERATRALLGLANELAEWFTRTALPSLTLAILPPAVPAQNISQRGWHIASVPALSAIHRRGPPLSHLL